LAPEAKTAEIAPPASASGRGATARERFWGVLSMWEKRQMLRRKKRVEFQDTEVDQYECMSLEALAAPERR